MRMQIAIAVLTSALVSFSVQAGEFNVWTFEAGKGQVHVEVSFAGDGVTQDAQLDAAIPSGYSLVEAKVLVPGSVCVGSTEHSLVRAVPPSGAGKALTSKDVNYCRFVFARGAAAKGKLTFEPKLTECAGQGAAACGVNIQDVSGGAGDRSIMQ